VSQALVLDAGALIALERRSPQLQELIRSARSRRASLVMPAAALAQVVRSGGRQAICGGFWLIPPCGLWVWTTWPRCGSVRSLARPAQVTLWTRPSWCVRVSWGLAPVITSDPQDLRKVDAALPLIVI
jgi:hypothetical protein